MNAPSLKEENALTITRVFDAPANLVFKVWTTPEHLARWWGPKGFTVPAITTDFREGGAWRGCIRSPEGQDYWAHGIYREIVAPSRIVLSFAWEEEGSIDTLITVTLDDVAGGTRLTFHQAPFTSAESRDSHAEGWSECMDRLVSYVAARKEEVQ
ncbi:SRPBCC family protein [Sinorhizobium meliloti]|uniref:SRPBCC family protein n=1 Tax=Rhizobium meliloti TaxID=382 RepID=UPI000BB1A133|nr:SRPBCC domain-containing protein [Sinorhizobium meliloti]ATA96108.1 polyketide cyclase [Sinorhizobium meliloti]ATB02986.1 polyketide cyclase [Sinorhizobium meliloti]QQF02165.1 SRPBCC domain-containing protein [Sinorhizobium meliloti]WQP17969.1 SRPBCC domain-containing protein [Sinorhizobium meliloti]WQP31431.1 SRPBCC domain-containing protein [Sinorhizobium meliloti]